jgi:hypothetical protein
MITHARLQDIATQANALRKEADELVKGRRVRIVINWNGQPIGFSRPNKCGKEYTVTHSYIDQHYGVCLFLEGEQTSIPVAGVDFII